MDPAPRPSETSCRRSSCSLSMIDCADSDSPATTLRSTASARLANRPDGRTRIVRLENRPKVLTGTRTADCSPLAHSDAVPVAATVQGETPEITIAFLG